MHLAQKNSNESQYLLQSQYVLQDFYVSGKQDVDPSTPLNE